MEGSGDAGHGTVVPLIWFVDGNNVMGSRPDGWWNDRPAAMARLADEVAEWCWTHEDSVVLVFDGRRVPSVVELAGGNLEIAFAPRPGRNAADDVITARSAAAIGHGAARVVVVTADRGLRARLDPTIGTEGPGSFLTRIGAGQPPD